MSREARERIRTALALLKQGQEDSQSALKPGADKYAWAHGYLQLKVNEARKELEAALWALEDESPDARR